MSSFVINFLQTQTMLMCSFLLVGMEWLAFVPVYRPWFSQAEILKNIALPFFRDGKQHRITSKNITSTKSETHNPSPSRKIWRKKNSQAKRQERKQKEFQPSNEDKGDKKEQLLEGKAATKKKEKNILHVFGQLFAEEWIRNVRCKGWPYENWAEHEWTVNYYVLNFCRLNVWDGSNFK